MDRFNIIYKELTPEELDHIHRIKVAARELSELFIKHNRETMLALTNLEQSIMWAIKGVCIEHKSE